MDGAVAVVVAGEAHGVVAGEAHGVVAGEADGEDDGEVAGWDHQSFTRMTRRHVMTALGNLLDTATTARLITMLEQQCPFNLLYFY